MGTVEIWGAGEDLVLIDGDIKDEFCFPIDREWADLEHDGYIVCSDGTVLRIWQGWSNRDKVWRLEVLVAGSAVVQIDKAVDDSDLATLEGDIRWVALASNYAVKKESEP